MDGRIITAGKVSAPCGRHCSRCGRTSAACMCNAGPVDGRVAGNKAGRQQGAGGGEGQHDCWRCQGRLRAAAAGDRPPGGRPVSAQGAEGQELTIANYVGLCSTRLAEVGASSPTNPPMCISMVIPDKGDRTSSIQEDPHTLDVRVVAAPAPDSACAPRVWSHVVHKPVVPLVSSHRP